MPDHYISQRNFAVLFFAFLLSSLSPLDNLNFTQDHFTMILLNFYAIARRRIPLKMKMLDSQAFHSTRDLGVGLCGFGLFRSVRHSPAFFSSAALHIYTRHERAEPHCKLRVLNGVELFSNATSRLYCFRHGICRVKLDKKNSTI